MTDEPIRFPEGPSDDDIAARLRRVREELDQMELPDLPEDAIPQVPPGPKAPDFDEQFRALDEKVSRVRDQWDTNKKTEAKKLASSAETNRGLGIGMSVAYTIIGLPLVGFGIGVAADQATGSTIWRGVGGFLGSVIGVVGAIILLNKYQKMNP